MEVTTATADALEARKTLQRLYEESPVPIEERMVNPFLYVRSSILVKALVMDDLYRRILNVPGDLVEFGVWYGQNLVLLENLRAIHEPFNVERRIVGFDSFAGYEDGTYTAGIEHVAPLQGILAMHRRMNAHGGGRYGLVVGDVTETAPKYFWPYDGFVALALFDMGPYEPTKAAMQAILPHLLPGSVILLDELANPGEARAFKEVFGGAVDYAIEKVALYPSKTVVTIK
jgi:hypothetical protein